MNRIAALLVALGLATLHGPAAVAEGGGGRDFRLQFDLNNYDDEEPETETQDEAFDYSWMARYSLGGSGRLYVQLSDDEYVQTDFTTAHPLDDNFYSQVFKGTGSEVEFGSAFAYERNVYISPKFEGFKLGATFDPAKPVQIVEQVEDHDDWGVELGVNYEINPMTLQLRATYREAEEKGERLGGVLYHDNLFLFRAGLSFAAPDVQPEIAVKTEPEIQLGTEFRGAFQRGFLDEFDHIAVRVSKYEDFRLDLSTAYVVRDDDEGGGTGGLKDPLKAIAGLFSSNSDDADAEQRFGTAVFHRRNLYVIPDSLTGFHFKIDPEQDIEIIEDLEGQDDWGIRLRASYTFNELTNADVDAYAEAAVEGRKYADVTINNENQLRLHVVMSYGF